MIFDAASYWLTNAHVPSCLIDLDTYVKETREGLCLVDLQINQGKIEQVVAASNTIKDLPSWDLQQKIVLPCLIDVHTHLDKGHIWERSPNLDGTFEMALDQARADSAKYWTAEDVYRRMEFGLKCSYAHGTQAIRTHIDSFGKQADISLEVFQSLQSAWRERITLQAVSLVSLDYYQTDGGIVLADKIAHLGAVLGGVAWQNPDLDAQLDTIFTLAQERNLDLDFHAAVQSADLVTKTIELVKQGTIAVVSLPMCNLYLQDRQEDQTPHWRGVTRVKELEKQGIPVSFASDNCRDPFFGFGDHDVLEVFEQAVKIAHLDTPYGNWIESVTTKPASLMGLDLGNIKPGNVADIIIFPARGFSELLARSQHDRLVIRQGKKINTQLPDYSELEDLLGF